MGEDERPVGTPRRHSLGEALDALSLSELDERIILLRDEIVRLECARAAKRAAADVAASVFGRSPSR